MAKRKVIVIGLDGMEPSVVESMLGQEELPHFARLSRAGFYGRVRTTCPAQTPVAWSTFATGTNPGGHGIFDFVRRDPETYELDFALSRFEAPKNIFAQPRVRNLRQGIPFWQLLGQRGIPSTILRCPCTFPPDAVQGVMLAGVGVPDLRGSQGVGIFYTQEQSVQAKENEQVVHLEPGRRLRVLVTGPRNLRANPPATVACEMNVEVDPAAGKLILHTGGEPPNLELSEGAWSPWVRLPFKLSMLQTVRGIVRFYLRQVTPQLEFYCSPVNFDPAAPLFPISSPAEYSRQLCEQIGLFSTLGMAEDHNGLNNGRFDETAYLDQCDLVFAEREKMTFLELARFQEGLFFVVFDTTDRLQHMLWRFRDPTHPFFDPSREADLGRAVEEHYRRCDGLLGRVLESVDDQTLLVVLSDHGFNSFRRAFHLNTWLCQNGLLALQRNGKPGEEVAEGFNAVDWSRTFAYALGLAGVYLNLRGREGQGIVERGAEASRILEAIQRGLTGLPDVETQQIGIRSVLRREDAYSGPYAADSPDLLVNYAPGYRVSWQTALGGIPQGLFEDNVRRWSGDHIIDPEAVPGVLFLNRAARPVQADMRDLAPTILNYLGLPKHQSMEGDSLLRADSP